MKKNSFPFLYITCSLVVKKQGQLLLFFLFVLLVSYEIAILFGMVVILQVICVFSFFSQVKEIHSYRQTSDEFMLFSGSSYDEFQ